MPTPSVLAENALSQSASDRAYDHVKRLIIRGDLAGGTAISENTLCVDLGLSRTPVHEAFLRLAAEDLLTLEARKGAVVRPMSPSEATDVLELREAVEGTAAARVIHDGRQHEIAEVLAELLTAQASAVEERDVDRFVELDSAFHGAVVEASRNAIAVHVSQMLRDRQQRLRHQLLRVRPEQLAATYEEHRALARALEREDAAAYQEVLGAHVASHRGAM